MADLKPSEIATLLSEILDVVTPDLLDATVIQLVTEHVQYWRRVDARSNARFKVDVGAWDLLVTAKEQVMNLPGTSLESVGGGLRDVVKSATSASTMLASDLPGGRQVGPPPPE